MTVAHVYRITFKQRNFKVTIKQTKLHVTKKGKNNEVSLEIIFNRRQFIITITHSQPHSI